MTYEQTVQLCYLMQVLQAELKVELADVDPLDQTPCPDDRTVKALAAAYELQDYAANQLIKFTEMDLLNVLATECDPDSIRGQLIAVAKEFGGLEPAWNNFEAFCLEQAANPTEREEFEKAFAELHQKLANLDKEDDREALGS